MFRTFRTTPCQCGGIADRDRTIEYRTVVSQAHLDVPECLSAMQAAVLLSLQQ